ncbi:MAG: hypothetical protein ACOC9T_00230 [Myxococcota bacterium]
MPHEPSADIPDTLTIGDTWRWTRSLSDHSPEDGWTLKYQFSIDPDTIALTIEAEADGANFLVDEAPSTSEGLTPGIYRWAEYVEKDDDRFTIDRGKVELQAVIHESRAARMVRVISEAIEDIVEGRVQQANINSRGRTLISLADLREELRHWQGELEQEENPGLGPQIAARMQSPGFTRTDLPFPYHGTLQ